MSSRTRHQPPPLWHPKLWPSHLAIGFARLLVRLPTRTLTALGSGLGRAFRRLSPSRRHVAAVNLQQCFPNLNAIERNQLEVATFESTGVAAMETLWTWLGSHPKHTNYMQRGSVEGLDILQAAQSKGRGVLLLGTHMMALDCIAPWMASLTDSRTQLDVVYRYNKNPIIERLMTRGRGQFFADVIEREDTRAMVRSLRNGKTLWYAPDQDYGAKHSVFADFFGVPAASITGTARLAKLCNSPIVFMSQYRDIEQHRWRVCFEAGPENYPSDDEEADAQAINALIERAIERAPEQYLWLHRRFKTRPPGTPKLY